MKKRIIHCLSAVMLLALTACTESSDNPEVVNPGGEETATVRISLGIEGRSLSRASGTLDSDSYEVAASSPEISDGTRATTLIYALYKKEPNGSYTALKIDGATNGPNYQVVKDGINFPYDELSFDLVKGFEYTMVFWAQSPEKDGKKYFDTSDLGAIEILYDDMENNDELRDAFCARYQLKVTQNEENVNVTLKRPFAQINVGISPKAWEILKRNWKHPVTSAITLSGLCDTYNLLEEKAVYADESSLRTVEFKAAIVPDNEDFEYNTTKFLQIDMNHDGKYTPATDENPEQFYWVSMCYVLVPDYVGQTTDEGDVIYSTTVDLAKLDLNYAAYTEIEPNVEAGTLNPDPVNNLPTLRNHRTNLILDGWPFVTKNIKINLDNSYNGDMSYPENKNQN